MTIFCQRCGQKNKEEASFCRNCGENFLRLRKETEQEDFRSRIRKLLWVIFVLSCAGSLLCSFFSIFFDFGKEFGFITIILLTLSVVLISISLLSIYAKMYLDKTAFKEEDTIAQKSLSERTKNLLSEADFSHRVPTSVVENTTRKLKEEILQKK